MMQMCHVVFVVRLSAVNVLILAQPRPMEHCAGLQIRINAFISRSVYATF